jgi:nitrite reductase/ring-hydroxylating ferredoxin subunit
VINVDGELYAILDNCLHMNYPLHEAGSTSRQPGGVNEKTCSIKCPWHGLEWSLEDGYNATLNKNLPTFDVETRGTEVYLIR